MKTNLYFLLWTVTFLGLSSCASVKPYYKGTSDFQFERSASKDLDYSLYLTGGTTLNGSSAVLEAIDKDRSVSSGLILLGDVISIDDVPANAIESNTPLIQYIKSLDAKFKDFYIVPGEKEWSSEKRVSYDAISSLDDLLKDVKKEHRLIEPRKGCGSPEVVRVSDHTVIAFIDSQWAIESETRKGEKMSGCELGSVLELRKAIKDIIQNHADGHIIFAVHHPIYTNGPTAGNYPLSSHLLPLP